MMDITSTRKGISNFFQVDAKLGLAFQHDCEALLEQFKKNGNLTYRAFSQLWTKVCFMSIFEGNNNILCLQTFIDNCFLIIKKFLYSDDLCIQTGAIYLLYGIYYKQPIKQWVKIRVTQNDVNKLNLIIEIHKMSNLMDPVFIYAKMRMDSVFEYCVLPQALGVEALFTRRVNLTTEEISVNKKASVFKKFKNLVEEDPDLLEFEETDRDYQKCSQQFKNELFVFPSKLSQDLRDVYKETFNVELDRVASTSKNCD